MANAVATATVAKSWADSAYHVLGTLAISANPAVYVTGGIAMNLNQSDIKASRLPIMINVIGQSGYIYEYVPGTDNSNGKLKVMVQGAAETDPLEELAASAIPAGVSGDTINFSAIYKGME